MWFEKYYKRRKTWIVATIIISILSACAMPYLKFAFNFEQFFPTGDEDLEFFQDFIEEFETDDNFLLIALPHKPSIFDTSFLKKLAGFSKDCKDINYVTSVQSLSLFKYPVLSGFIPGFQNAIHIDNPQKLEQDSIKLMRDERIVHNLINEKATATVVLIKNEDAIQIDASKEIMAAVDALILKHDIKDYHILGRAYFQTELSELQFKEIILSTVVSGLLISIVMILIFSKWRSILIALGSIGLALVIFMGTLSILGRELTLMAALYPVLMLIVGTSDVVHIMTKYFDELKKGLDKKSALEITVKQIGMATLLTSLTTAAGFATLLSSRIIPIRDFGINSAIGVIIAYIVVISFTCPLMTFFEKDVLVNTKKKKGYWAMILDKFYYWGLNHGKLIFTVFLGFIFLSIYGITKINTNYELEKNLPRGAKITEDFNFFENEFAGFRPLELAGYLQEGYDIYDYEVIDAINKTENYIREKDEIQTSFSLATLIKSLNQMMKGNDYAFYKMPEKEEYDRAKAFLSNIPMMGADILISKDKRKTRISTKVKDIGADNIKELSKDIDMWIAQNVDPTVIQFKQTGTGIILDKNSEFVRESLTYGLGIALVLVSLLMGFLFKSFKYLFIALIPNTIPLLFAAAILGFGGIPLEAGVSIVFAIIFGIAVDDTIHFMSKYKMAKDQFGDKEKAMYVTFQESGKAIIYTSIILFFGFLILMFSANLPSVIIGMLISVTLISAVIADLLLLPVVIRWFD